MSALSTFLEQPMAAKKRGRPVTSDREDASVKINREIKAQAEYIAARRRIPIAVYLSEILAPLVARDFKKAQDDKSS
jgi:hypothetical protein